MSHFSPEDSNDPMHQSSRANLQPAVTGEVAKTGNPFSVLQILKLRWRPAVLAGICVVAAGVLFTATRKPIYEGHTMLVLVTSGGGAGSGADSLLGNLTALTSSKNADTQIEILAAPDLLNDVYDAFPASVRTKAFGKLEHPYEDVKLPKWSYQFENTNETDVVDVTGRAYDPKIAADLANNIAKLYLDRNLQQNNASAAQARAYVDRETVSTQNDLKTATDELAQLQKKNGLAASDPNTQAIEQNVMTLRQEVFAANSNLSQVEGQLQAATDQLKKVAPDILTNVTTTQNPAFAQVQYHLVDLQTQYSALSRQFKSDTPQIKRLRGEIADDQARLKSLTQNLITSEERQANPVLQQLLADYATTIESEASAKARVREATTALSAAYKELDTLPGIEQEFARLQENVNVLQMTFEDLKARHYQLLIEERSGLPNGVIASFAHPAEKQSSPKVLLNAIVTLVLAILAAVITALWSESHDKTVHASTPIEAMTGLSVLAALPLVGKQARNSGERLLISSSDVHSGFTEAIRLLRNSIAFSMPDRTLKVIIITSPGASEGKSTTAVNLAIALAMDGKRVLLVDVDLRRPSLHKWMEGSRENGLTEAVSGKRQITDVIHPTQHANLEYIPSGPLPPNPSEFLNTSAFRGVITELRGMYDILVLDAPPTTGLSDVQVLSTIADGVLLVVSQDVTLKHHLAVSVRMLGLVGAPLLGLVLNQVRDDASGYGYYYYYYYYNDYSMDDESGKKGRKRNRRGRK